LLFNPGKSKKLEAKMGIEITPIVQALLVKLGWLMVVILLDLALGITVALKAKTFDWSKVADVVSTYGPKVLVWVALEMLDLLPAEYKALVGLGSSLGLGVYVLIFMSAIGSIGGHIQALGLPFNLSILGIRSDNES